MDDLKVVLYIVVAIIWVVYNNYKKISEASKKRDFTKPPAEVIQENWPVTQEKKVRPDFSKPKEVVVKKLERGGRLILERQPLPKRNPIRPQPAVTRQKSITPAFYGSEGGTTTPSKVVQFEDQSVLFEEPNVLLTALRSMDLRQGIVLAEVLKRPYN